MSAIAERPRRFLDWDRGIVVQVTRFGLGFVLVTLVVAVGATNTGNNGLYLLLSLFLSVLVVSGVVSKRNVAALRPRLEGPEEVFAGEPVRCTLSLGCEGANPRPRTAILVTAGAHGGPWLFPSVDPGASGTARREVEIVFPVRGRARVEPLVVFSSYPIGLFRKGRRHPSDFERVVFPSPIFGPLPDPEPGRDDQGGARSERRGRGAGIRNLREALPGDDPRDIHWPQTARQGSPIVRERDSEESRSAVVLLEGGGSGFEEAVSEAAGAVLQLLARGERVGLVAGEVFVPPGEGRRQRRALLAALAVAAPAQAPHVPLPGDVALYLIRTKATGRVGP
jgi:uncharacterized protein (DUF58 family)